MNITKGCIISCDLLHYDEYVPLIVRVTHDEYKVSPRGNIFHYFEVEIIRRLTRHKYNKYFKVSHITHARATDLYKGEIIEYPENYAYLVAEKATRKLIYSKV